MRTRCAASVAEVIEGDVREARGGLLKPPKFTPGTRTAADWAPVNQYYEPFEE